MILITTSSSIRFLIESSKHTCLNSVWKRFGLVQGPPEALPHLFSPQPSRAIPHLPRRCGAFGRAASSRFLIVGALGPPNRNRPPAARHCVCPAFGRSSAPAAPALRLALGRALRARPCGGRLVVRDANSDCCRLRAAVFFLLQRHGSAILYQGFIPLGSHLPIRAIVSPIGESSFYQYDYYGR